MITHALRIAGRHARTQVRQARQARPGQTKPQARQVGAQAGAQAGRKAGRKARTDGRTDGRIRTHLHAFARMRTHAHAQLGPGDGHADGHLLGP